MKPLLNTSANNAKNNLVVYWLNPPQSTQSIYPDLAWMNFSACARDHTWIQPITDWERMKSVEDVVAHVLVHAPDVLCVSTYVWNYRLCQEVAAEIRARLPNIVIVQGGPHQGFSPTFFSQHPYVDYSCYATGHGEYFIKPFLEQIAVHGTIIDPDRVPYLLSRTHADPSINRKYEYPEYSSLEYNVEYLLNCADTAAYRSIPMSVMLETTRGCPYSCTYCEWGGGTSSKVSVKSLDIIKREIDLIGTFGVHSLDIIDANFGIINRDIDIVRYIAEVKQATTFPKRVMLYGVAKTSVTKREQILDVLYQHQLMTDYPVSIQSISSSALKAIKRTDISLEDNIALSQRMMEKYGANPRVELILGLPGSTIDDFYAEMDLYHRFYADRDRFGWQKPRSLFTLLPDTPAADPKYMAVNGMKSIPTGIMEGEEASEVWQSDSVLDSFKGSARIVIQSGTYTVEHWKDMFLLNRIQRTVGPLLRADAVASVFFRTFMADLKQSDYYQHLREHVDLIVTGKMQDSDLISMNGVRIEDHVMHHYVLPRSEKFEESLDFTLCTA